MTRDPENSEVGEARGPSAVPDDDPRAVLLAAQDPARYLGLLDGDDPFGGESAASASTPVPAVDSLRGLDGVAARLAAALAEDDALTEDDDAPDADEPADEALDDAPQTESEDETESGGGHPAGPPPDPRVPHHRLRHPVLRAPATARRSAAGEPDPARSAHYRAHSADLVLGGGIETALASGAAVCALAEQYVLRRVGGSSATAVTAASAAVAELGRTAPEPSRPGPPDAVRPGFAGLAGMLAWLGGEPSGGAGPGWRLARMFRPDPDTRALHRLVVAIARPRSPQVPRRSVRVVAAALGLLDRGAWTVIGLLWLGALLGCVGVVTAIAGSPHVAGVLVPVATVPIAVTFALAAACGTLWIGWHAVRAGVRTALDGDAFGLVRGVSAPGLAPAAEAPADEAPADEAPADGRRLDRLAGLLPPGGTPALFTWISDRLDDLAGVPSPSGGAERYAVTFGELWLGRMGGRASADLRQLRRAASDPRRRVIDLVLVTTDVSAGRPRLMPFGATERPEQLPGSSFTFCRACLVDLMPARVADQMVLMAPGDPVAPDCPRHPGEPLHHLPEPWDLPVAFAVRLAAATPGLLRPVPLYTSAPDGGAPRTHWLPTARSPEAFRSGRSTRPCPGGRPSRWRWSTNPASATSWPRPWTPRRRRAGGARCPGRPGSPPPSSRPRRAGGALSGPRTRDAGPAWPPSEDRVVRGSSSTTPQSGASPSGGTGPGRCCGAVHDPGRRRGGLHRDRPVPVDPAAVRPHRVPAAQPGRRGEHPALHRFRPGLPGARRARRMVLPAAGPRAAGPRLGGRRRGRHPPALAHRGRRPRLGHRLGRAAVRPARTAGLSRLRPAQAGSGRLRPRR